MRSVPRFALSLALLAPCTASAVPTPPPTDGGWHVGADVLTEFPLMVGVGVHLETPNRFRFHSSIGVMPSSYLDSLNAVATTVGWYDEFSADLIKAALEDALVWRLRAGWRPLPSQGLYGLAGYTLATLGGGLTGAELISVASGRDLPDGVEGTRRFDLGATVHLLDLEIGWEFIYDALVLRTAVGAAFSVHASSDVEAGWDVPPARQPAVDRFAIATQDWLDGLLEDDLHGVTASVAVGWRF